MRGLRRAIGLTHLWLGLGLGGLMALAGVTGSLLVFYIEIDRLLHPQIQEAGLPGAGSYDAALRTLRRQYPEKSGAWRFEVTGRPNAIPARYYNPPETAGRSFAPMMVWVSPDGARILRRDFWGDYAMTWIYDLHYQLRLDKRGQAILGYAGIGLCLLFVTGLLTWWPRGRLSKALRFKRPAHPLRRLRDIHKLAGLAGLPLLLIATGTGVMLALPAQSDAVLAAVMAPPSKPGTPAGSRSGDRQISVERAIQAARAMLPDARLAWIEVPGPGPGVFRLRMRQPGDPSYRFPHSYVSIDQYTGAVIDVHDARKANTATTINNWLHPLHDASVGGMVTRVPVAVAGLLPAVLFATGLIRWMRRRR
ncbi:MAG: PepSY-associated TM helix domain-containing protein [Gammaproteobacteria bacterium]